MKIMKWYSIKDNPPPENIILNTRIEENGKIRNEQPLVKKGNLWWTKDRKMYVYYRPTHWEG